MQLPVRLSLPAVVAIGLASAFWATAARSRDRIESPAELAIHQPCDCPVRDGVAEVDLPPLPPGERYRVIVSSLAEFPSTWDVRLSCRPVAVAERPADAVRAVPALTQFRTAGRFDPSNAPSRPRSATPSQDVVATQRRFAIHVTDGPLEDPAHYATITANLQESKRRIRVYLDEQCQPTPERIRRCRELAEIAGGLLPQLEDSLGPLQDVDNDGGLTLVLTPWLGRLQSGRTSLGGFVRSGDFRPLPPPFSNQGDIVYLNADLPPNEALQTLLAHEMTHVLAIGCRVAAAGARCKWTDEEDWLSEGLAHLLENQHAGASNIDHRIARFCDDPSRYPLVVDDYYRSGLWRNHGCRGATWSFLSWCRGRFGPEFPRRLANSRFRGTANLEHATGVSFGELFREWTLACMKGEDREERIRVTSNPPTVGRFEKNPPLCHVLQAEREPRRFPLASTAASSWELPSPDSSLPYRLRVEASPTARLQVTVVRVPAESAQLTVRARWTGESRSSAGGLEILVEDGTNSAVEIESVTLQRFTQTLAETLRFDASNISNATPPSFRLALAEATSTRIPLDRSAQPEPDGLWALRLVARRPDGSRVFGGTALPMKEATAIAAARDKRPQ